VHPRAGCAVTADAAGDALSRCLFLSATGSFAR
jgi:hypothetical protein